MSILQLSFGIIGSSKKGLHVWLRSKRANNLLLFLLTLQTFLLFEIHRNCKAVALVEIIYMKDFLYGGVYSDVI